MPDPQVKKLYAWESKMGWDASNIKFHVARNIIREVCYLYNVPEPTVRLHTTHNLPFSIPRENIISLQRDRYLNIPIALHEATHHIIYHKRIRVQDHGPTFMGIYLDLLARNGFDMYNSAYLHGLKWKSVSSVDAR